MLKKAYAISRKNIINTEKTHDDLVLNDKKIDVFYKNADKQLSKKNSNIFEEAKSCLI